MTTKLTIDNDATSNGDVLYQGVNTCEGNISGRLFPGEQREIWITTNSSFFITETWPTEKPKAAPEGET